MLSFVNKHGEDNDDYYFAVVRREDNQVIGGTNISINERGEFCGGIWLHRNFQGKGYGTELWIARAKFAFEILGVKELVNGYYYFNERSKKMQEKIGYKTAAEKMSYCPALKREIKEIVTKLTKSDFEKFYNDIEFEFYVE